jgi:2-keto-4-pentenoate hydratase/2-oxohepta-3-ene-1,7-dioic acid hydratase in catechol pathway
MAHTRGSATPEPEGDPMRFVTFEKGGEARVGAVVGEDIVDLSVAAPELPRDMKALIAKGVGADLQGKLASAPASARTPLAGAKLKMPILDPGKTICLGLNYQEHAKEGGHEKSPDYPALFMRATTSLIGPHDPLVLPKASDKFDYEAELMLIVGKRCRHLTEANALDAVFGYSCFNDGSIRDYQRKTAQWTPGKNFDGTGPVGPWIVTADELPPGAEGLRIRSILNGSQTLQDDNTSNMVFKVAQTLAILSEVFTLEPGDMIAMGTPSGVGFARKPPLFLKAGDTLSIDIEKIGRIDNKVVAEK